MILEKVKSRYDGTYYNLLSHNCRTYVHSVSHILGLGDTYLRIVTKYNYFCAIDYDLIKSDFENSLLS